MCLVYIYIYIYIHILIYYTNSFIVHLETKDMKTFAKLEWDTSNYE